MELKNNQEENSEKFTEMLIILNPFKLNTV